MVELVLEATGIDFRAMSGDLEAAKEAALEALSEHDESRKFSNNIRKCSSIGRVLNEVWGSLYDFVKSCGIPNERCETKILYLFWTGKLGL